MTALTDPRNPVTFTPNLRAGDLLAVHWMRQVTLRLRREICWLRYERGMTPDEGQGTLPPFVDKASASLDLSRYAEEKRRFFAEDVTAAYLTRQLEIVPLQRFEPVRGSFAWTVVHLELDEVATFVLALGLVPMFDNAMGSVIAACLNDPVRTLPNLALAQKLWDHPEKVPALADPAHPLFRHGLLVPADPDSQARGDLDWDHPLSVPATVANHLLFPDAPLPRVLAAMKEDGDDCPGDPVPLIASRLSSETARGLRVVPILGSGYAAGAARAVAKRTGRGLVTFRPEPGLSDHPRYLNALATLCWLRDLDLFLEDDGKPVSGHQTPGPRLPLHSIPINLFLAVRDKDRLNAIPDRLMLPIIHAPTCSYEQRLAHWQKLLGSGASPRDLAECTRRFRYEKHTIDEINRGLEDLPRPISREKLMSACRAAVALDIGDSALRVIPRFEDETLILPRKQDLQFREVLNAMRSLTRVHHGWGTARAWNEGGISVLFAGPPGVGKTMAAEVLALELDLPLYRIDLSQVVNKYIGETEKNLKRLFDAAEISDIILFVDEADARFGRRTEVKDAHDRYANLEISYLLERMERFKGLAILASNRKKDLDEAFLRRLRFIVDFPLPDVAQRERIWRQVIPKAVDAAKLDFELLAKRFPLAGGHIRSIVFNACLQSADGNSYPPPKGCLTMESVVRAIKREYDKLNRSVSIEQFGPYIETVADMERAFEKD